MSDPRAVLFTRRDLLSVTAVAASAAMFPPGVYASGFHRFTHGAFDITVVSDGFITLPAEILLPDTTPEERQMIMARLGGNDQGAPVQANIPLIRHGDDLILIDNGSGSNFQSTAGKLAVNLSALGVDPAKITKVVFTHAHPDHSGATTTSDGKVLYPNAHYFVSRVEWDFWTDKNFEAKMPQVLHGFAQGAQRDLFAVRDRLTLVKPGEEIVPGMLVVGTPGHTPGHISIELAGDGNLLVTGDACTNDVIFFEHPSWHFGFDTDAETALKSRQMLLDRAASEKLRMLGYHWAYPGIGYAERRGSGYAFVKA
ncbi:MBL fold metallo-hydrolase [Sinorhizobium meliloti]|uniref:Metallo-beta-lactamase family protein n=1 Tax=Sinorhizobium meliloti (strain SM11) TaxID=707241 RepID=F7XBK7_SINMM|nr:MBL fold metallo-hydrolase [Sinorhizobium meliloti]PST20236.1 MBL fold metallo-hydrolase [Mesorhizobium loti]AEH82525.1 metallo-beta-lactamase family protein [Sinorhizobium meliloti SM11]ASP66612.1 MBL fold metallo-hydrolase [Sinorhizobium meliloti]MBP2470252.1 glyoxylase-like metal-dependent hydrolase (beta-lactamase superfamily II) [Sinorhizobium meliloti]MDE3762937.1 MBL fold metallo-hydrolase [Sinorhizobium meliloti]